jgi:oligosaccharyl transferase (archaeosortase A-associated)
MSPETSRKLFIGILIFLFFAIALIYRVALPYDKVFTSEGIKFTSNDAYFHMRIVDSMVHNSLHATAYDPYLIYPNASSGLAPTFMDWLLAVIILIVGLGSPTAHTIDVVGVYFPAVMAALTVIPVFFIGKALFNRWVGVFAAALTAVFAGEFLGRSILGFTDNHVAETFFSTIALLFIILAVKSGGEKQLCLSHLTKFDWKTVRKPLVYSLLAGIFLAIYLLTWQGALMFVFIATLYFIIQFIIDHVMQKSTEYLGITGFIIFLVALIIFMPFSPTRDASASVVIAMFVPPVLMVISMLMNRYKITPALYPLALAVLGGAFIGIFFASEHAVFTTMLDKFKLVFIPAGATATTTLEMQPFLSPQGAFSTQVAWGSFTTSFFMLPFEYGDKNLLWFPAFSIITIAISIWLYKKYHGKKDNQDLFWILFGLCIAATIYLWFFFPSSWKVYFPGFGIWALIIIIWVFTRQQEEEKPRLLLRIINILILVTSLVLIYLYISDRSTVKIILAFLALLLFFVTTIWLTRTQRDKDSQMMLLFVWTLVIAVATLVQRRFAYYLIINVALLSGFLCWQIVWYLSVKRKILEEPKSKTYIQARNIGILGWIIISIACITIVKSKIILIPLSFVGLVSLIYGCWGWAKYKEKNDIWALWGLIVPIGFIPLAFSKTKVSKSKVKSTTNKKFTNIIYNINAFILVIVVFSVIYLPNVIKSKDVAGQALFAPSNAWQSSLIWMRDNTPEPFGDPDAYFQLYQRPTSKNPFIYPASAYGVTAWWDYGYWITRIARRIPNDNPSQDPGPIQKVAGYFLSEDEPSAGELLKELGSRYTVIDYDICTSKFWAIVTWADKPQDEYTDIYYAQSGEKIVPVQVFKPSFFQTTLARLYFFDGKAVTTVNPLVITYEDKTDRTGYHFKFITAYKEFTDYQAALRYIASQTSGKYEIVSASPFMSPVPIDALDNFTLVHSSPDTRPTTGNGTIPEIKIFEYSGGR